MPHKSTSPLRWGIASTGGIAEQMTRTVNAMPGAEVVAVGSRSQETADRFASKFNVPRAHPSHTDLCNDPNVDDSVAQWIEALLSSS